MTRSLRNILGAIVAMTIATLVLMPSGAGAADPGVVQVKGATISNPLDVDLEDALGSAKLEVPGQGGLKGWPLRLVLEYAQGQTNAFDITTLSKNVRVSRTGKSDYSVHRFGVADKSFDSQLAIFFINSDGNTAMWQNKGIVTEYPDRPPVIDVPKSLIRVEVNLSPGGPVRLKSGEAKTFTAVISLADPSQVTYLWQVDNKTQSSPTPGKFEFSEDKQGTYKLTVTALIPGASSSVDTASITVGKPEKKKKKDKEEDEPSDDNPPDDSGYYPGYYPGYGDGSGTGTGSGSPSPGSPSPSQQPRDRQPKDRQPSVDDGLETVSGQLVDPSQIATVVPPSSSPEASGEEPEPEDEGKGGGISKGAMTALGIGALLGLGGLTEAGAFAGRRFRFRP